MRNFNLNLIVGKIKGINKLLRPDLEQIPLQIYWNSDTPND